MKPILKELYKEEGRPLKEVMHILETEHQFYATQRMYKSKLKEWSFSKYVRATEAVAILKAVEQRQAAGKSSQIILRGEEVDLSRIKNYIRRNRNRGRLERLYVEERAAPEDGRTQLICRTPSPDPFGLRTPGLLEPAEGLYRALSGYVEMSFGTGNWFVTDDGRMRSIKGDPAWYSVNMKDLWNRLDLAASLVNAGEVDRVSLVKLLEPVFGYMPHVVANQYPRSISHMLGIFEDLYRRGRGDLVDTFLRHITGLSEVLLGKEHAQTRLWQSLLAIWADEHMELLDRFWTALLNLLRKQKVRSHLLEMSVYTDYYDVILIRTDWEAQELSLRRELERATDENMNTNSEQCQMMYLRHAEAMKQVYKRRGQYDLMAKSMDGLVEKGDWDNGLGIQARGEAALEVGDWEAAEGYYREAKEHIHVNPYWKDESWVLDVFLKLERCLRHNGKEEEADQVAREKLEHLATLQA